MASQRVIGDKQRFRHRLQEIKLEPNRSTHDLIVEIQVDGVGVHKLSEIKRGQLLHWVNLCLPWRIRGSDVHEDSKITLQVTEIHTFRDRVGRASYQVSQAASQNAMSIGCDNGLFKVNLKILDQEAAKRAYSEAFVKVEQMEEHPSLLEKAGKAGDAFKVLLTLGSTMADLDPTGGANVVFSVCTMAWEHLENQNEQNGQLAELVENIAGMIPSVESIKDLADTNLKQTVVAMLNLIEDVSVFILSYNSRSAWDQTWRSAFSSAAREKADGFVSRFARLRKEFDTRVNVQALRAAELDRVQAKLRELKPVDLASYDPARECIAGTRVDIINEIVAWVQRSDAGPSLAWVQGLAGLGKSSIATSVCRQLDEQHALASSFFCKRDNPELREPRRVLTTIIYGLARRWEAYGEAVVAVLREDPDLHSKHIQPLYDALVAKPLQGLTEAKQPTGTPVVVVDALDECGDNTTRKQLLACLRGMSQLVPSLKVIVTSRPDVDIQEFFSRSSAGRFTEYNVLNYDALGDIRIFVRDKLADMSRVDNWPQDAVERLAQRSSGLFIWAHTACKFIMGGYDRRKRFEQVLAGTRLRDSSSDLDVLYATAVKAGALDGDEDNMEYVLKCLGAVVVTAAHMPLPISSLAMLMRGRIPLDVLDRVIGSLSSVLYVDQNLDGAVRFSHPSFMDYITDSSRSKALCVDLGQQNTILAECCLETMVGDLKFNICNLETSEIFDDDIPNIETRVDDAIGHQLAYSCRFWSSHVAQAKVDTVDNLLRRFLFGRELLYWMEVLSLLGRLGEAPSNLLEFMTWCVSDDMQGFRTAASDAYRFVLTFYDAIQESTPHLYISALAFAPKKSEISQRMRKFFPKLLVATQGAKEEWTPCLRTISTPGTVTSIAFSPDSCRIVSGSEDNTVCIWDAETGDLLLGPLEAHSKEVRSVAFSHDGRRVVSGSEDRTVRIWDASLGDTVLEPLKGHLGAVISVAFSPNGHWIVSGSVDHTVRIWDADTGDAVLKPLSHMDKVLSVAFSHDSRRIVSGSRDGAIYIWEVATGNAVLNPLEIQSGFTVYSVAFSSNGRWVVSGSEDSALRIWDAETGDKVLELLRSHTGPVTSTAFSHDSRQIVSGSFDGTVCIWDAQTGDALSEPLQGHTDYIYSVAFSHDGRRIVSGSCDFTMRIWDALDACNAGAKREVLGFAQGHSGYVLSVAFSPNGRRVASGSSDTTVCVWDAETGNAVLKPLKGHSDIVCSVAFSHDGRRICSASTDCTVRIWDAESGDVILGPLAINSASATQVEFTPDDSRIVSISTDMLVCIWDAETGDAIPELPSKLESLVSKLSSRDGPQMVSDSDGDTGHIRDTGKDVVLKPLELHVRSGGVQAMALSRDGRRIVSGSQDGAVCVWDGEMGNAVFGSLHGHSRAVRTVAFSLDGRRIASGSEDTTVRVWDAETGDALLGPLQGHSDTVLSVAFSYDGHRIVTGSSDCTARIWDLEAHITFNSSSPSFLPGTEARIFPLLSGFPSLLSTSTQLARHVDSGGWVATTEGRPLLWLPPELRRIDDSSICMSSTPPRPQVTVDFTNFVHGNSWTSAAAL